MMKLLLPLILLSACSMGTVKTGGEGVYTFDQGKEYTSDELKELAPKVIVTSRRDPPVGKLDDLFSKEQKPLKRFGILIFETQIQPTRGGLASEDMVFLSEAGKQLMTEALLKIWEETITTIAPDLDFVTTARIKKSKAYPQFGLTEDDFVKSKRSTLAPDDIYFAPKGAKTPITTTINPRGMRDMSLVLVPATELMGGPKWSEQHKQFVNEMMKELKLDAVVIVMSDLSWTTARIDKHSGEPVAEEIKLKLSASTLTSLSDYRERAKKLKLGEPPSLNLCYRHYEGKLRVPVRLNVPASEQNFETIQKNLLSPLFKNYSDLTVMMVDQLSSDLRKTH